MKINKLERIWVNMREYYVPKRKYRNVLNKAFTVVIEVVNDEWKLRTFTILEVE